MRRETPQWTNRPFPYLKSVRANCGSRMHICIFTCGHTHQLPNCFKKAYVWMYRPTMVLDSPCIKTTNKCAFVCMWTPCVSRVLCMFCTRDMNSCFILSACAESDFSHFTGHPAVQLHHTCTLQFVSKRFPQITKHRFCHPVCSPYAEKMVWKIGLCLEPCGLAHRPLPLCGSGFKDKWLYVNQIWHAV